MTRRLFLMVLLGSLSAGACRRQKALTPPEIRLGRDVCSECGMIISERRFAAAAATANGDTTLFDDIGCLLAYRQKHSPAWAAIWVHDFESQTWMDASTARYLVSSGVRSPMGWGIAAFADPSMAEAQQHELGGELVTWDELLARPLQRPR
jgi:copper chaperone NosL